VAPPGLRADAKGRLAMRRSRPGQSISEPATAILCTAVSLFAFLATIRGVIVGAVPPPGSVIRATAKLLVASFYDFVFVALSTVVFLAALWLSRATRAARRAVVATYCLASAVTLLVALINIKNVQMLGEPFTYQWLYYSDFLTSKESHDAIASAIHWYTIVMTIILPVGMFLIAFALNRATTVGSVGCCLAADACHHANCLERDLCCNCKFPLATVATNKLELSNPRQSNCCFFIVCSF
jgi:hypothetical protein